MSSKFVTVLRNDGFYWLALDTVNGRVYLQKQARIGERFRPGAKYNG